MRNIEASEIDDSIETKNTTTQKDVQTEDETLLVRLNKDHVLAVNKEKLLEKSQYFKLITKSCFTDHKSEFIEVCVPVGIDVFKKVMIDYIMTDIISIKNKTVFEIFLVSDYLQIVCLSKLCWDHFVYNLNKKTLNGQINQLKNYPLLKDNFMEVALEFQKGERPSVQGLYMFKHNKYGYHFLQISDKEGFSVKFNKYTYRDYCLLLYFNNSIIMQGYDMSPVLLQFDLLSTDLVTIDLEYSHQSSVCSNNKNLFVVTPKKDEFTISILGKINYNTVLKVFETKTLCLFNENKPGVEKRNIHIIFSFYDDGKLYFFYMFYKYIYGSRNIIDYLQNVHMVTIHIESMTVISNEEVINKLRYNTGGALTQKENIRKSYAKGIMFDKMFFFKKAHKVVIKIEKHDKLVLVFDVKNEYFYFVEDMIPYSTIENDNYRIDYDDIKYTVDKDDKVYMYSHDETNSSVTQYSFTQKCELRTFRFKSLEDRLVETGNALKRNYVDNDLPCVKAICSV